VGALGGQVQEFRDVVAPLHDAGFDVLLDVVFNHTAEVDTPDPVPPRPGRRRLRPPGHRRGLHRHDRLRNSLNARHPVPLQMVMDSLRCWVTRMGVDGFRFDLAPTLGRQGGDLDAAPALFDIVAQDQWSRRRSN
jgi:glycogen operon protein